MEAYFFDMKCDSETYENEDFNCNFTLINLKYAQLAISYATLPPSNIIITPLNRKINALFYLKTIFFNRNI